MVANTCGMLAQVCWLEVTVTPLEHVSSVCLCVPEQSNLSPVMILNLVAFRYGVQNHPVSGRSQGVIGVFDGAPNGTVGLFCVRVVYVGPDLRGQAGPASG